MFIKTCKQADTKRLPEQETRLEKCSNKLIQLYRNLRQDPSQGADVKDVRKVCHIITTNINTGTGGLGRCVQTLAGMQSRATSGVF